jgi:hypothetical protein
MSQEKRIDQFPVSASIANGDKIPFFKVETGKTSYIAGENLINQLAGPAWSKVGNVLTGRAIFGNIGETPLGYDVKIDNDTIVYGVSNTGKHYFNTNAAFADTDVSCKGSDNSDETWNIQFQNLANQFIFGVKNDRTAFVRTNTLLLGSEALAVGGNIATNGSINTITAGGASIKMLAADLTDRFIFEWNSTRVNLQSYSALPLVLNELGNAIGLKTSPFANTDVSLKGSGNTSTSNGFRLENLDGTSYLSVGNAGLLTVKTNSSFGFVNVIEARDSANALLFEVRANANIKTPGGFLNASDHTTCNFFASNLYRGAGATVVLDWANTLLKDNSASDSMNWHFRYLSVGGTEKLNWNSNYLDGGNWRVNTGNNFALGSSPSYGSGVGVIFIANAGTDSAENPTGGVVHQSKSGRAMIMETDGVLSYLVKAVSATKVTAAAPYTNDGYVEVVINGTTLKFMTTT